MVQNVSFLPITLNSKSNFFYKILCKNSILTNFTFRLIWIFRWSDTHYLWILNHCDPTTRNHFKSHLRETPIVKMALVDCYPTWSQIFMHLANGTVMLILSWYNHNRIHHLPPQTFFCQLKKCVKSILKEDLQFLHAPC